MTDWGMVLRGLSPTFPLSPFSSARYTRVPVPLRVEVFKSRLTLQVLIWEVGVGLMMDE